MAGLIDSLLPLLEQDAAQLSTLEQMLNDERAALESRNNQLLQDTVERKAQAVEQLEHTALAKAQLFAQHGLKMSPQHVKAALAKVGRTDVLNLWEQVTDQLEHCKDLNEINGRIVFRSQQSIGRMMDILKGQDSQQKLYGQNGRGNGLGGRHLLANA